MTGGAATLSVSYQGKSYPICCTGCRDEFNDNPEKYLQKLAQRLATAASKPAAPKASRVSRYEDAFAGDADESEPQPAAAGAGTGNAAAPAAQARGDRRRGADNPRAAATKAKGSPADRAAARAATALRLAQNLEKSGKTALALNSYMQILKDHPATPAARTAAERIKAIEGR